MKVPGVDSKNLSSSPNPNLALYFNIMCGRSLTFLSPVAIGLLLLVASVSAFHVQRTTTRHATALLVDGQNMAGGARHLVGDIIRSLQPSYLRQVKETIEKRGRGSLIVDTSSMVDNAPSWEELRQRLFQVQTPSERKFRVDLERGAGDPSALANKRLFGGDTQPRVTFYRDSAAWCPYCAKVWMALEERRVSYEVVKIDMRCYGKNKPTEFLKMQPNGNLPCVVIEGRVISESDEIVDAVDQVGSSQTPRLRPRGGTPQAELFRELCDNGRNSLERRLYSRWMWWLTGVRRPAEYKDLFEEHLDEVEEALVAAPNGGPYFLGKELSEVDIRFGPFIERQIASLAYFKGYNIRDGSRPCLQRWLRAMESRASYRATKSDWYTHSQALPPQLSADCAPESGHEELQGLIDDLPVHSAVGDSIEQNNSFWIEPGWDWCSDPAAAKREAAERVIHNHADIVRFASRAAGVPGLPASAAPLADPRATPSKAAEPAVDLLLRHTVNSLLASSGRIGIFSSMSQQPGSSARDVDAAVASLASGPSGIESAQAVADCLDYLRARVGVPRDMTHTAAQQLRAELKGVSVRLRSAVGMKEKISA